jgi:hypothetical protein
LHGFFQVLERNGMVPEYVSWKIRLTFLPEVKWKLPDAW